MEATSAIVPTGTVTASAVARADGAAVSGAPTVSGVPTVNGITVNAVTIPSNSGSQTVEYAISTSTATPTSGWQAQTAFGGLATGTTYYVFARSAANANYDAGTAQRSNAITTVLETGAVVSVTTASGRAGQTVTVDLNIENNPGFAGMVLKIAFPQELTLTRYDLANMDLVSGFTGPNGISSGAPCNISGHFYMLWGRNSDYTQNGRLATFTFAISENAVKGDYPISVTFEMHTGPQTPTNLLGTPLHINIENGAVTVANYILGDITGSGDVGPADLVLLARYLAGHNVTLGR
jgi:hypothetical protein